ncbi:putative multidrug export ATP-binding/permease protein [Clostridium homopropionicum DSM 5847]|uniref:Putative multidrug export ATP-binding/permease protein n=1 Tax=Clostridium homopropionicum DSM 5847 TaxID=1121318 RepID=A0A0L6ZEB0_9CLOT|nr:ABC transporter ATP-binding protein [Clostridium homopropionicum]KOA21319.1 putative multidrug export ATP-binding/permease protein [Clostridium homopropionicum DSM 5847]SFG95674.1 ATP-binding cassette, subfamily B [Clostridium homopropionicum]
MNSIKKFISYYNPYKFLFFSDMFCSLILSGIDLLFPLVVRYLLNDVYTMPDRSKIIHYVLLVGSILLVLYIVRYFCQYFITSWGHIMGAKMEADMRKDIFDHLQKLSFSYYDEHNTGKLMSRIVTDLFDISELAHHGPEDVFISIVKITGSFIILLSINAKLTLILLFFTFAMLVFSYSYNIKMRNVFKKNREKIANVNAQIQDSLSGIRVVKSFANEDIESSKFKKGNEEFLETKEDSYFIMGKFFSGNSFFQGILYLSVILLGGIFISLGTLKTSDLVIYILYINIFLNPIEKLINFTEQFQRGITGFERFLEIINTKPDIEDKENTVELTNPKGDIEFKNVSFSYNDKHTVLNNLNIKIPSGKTIALVGPSGGGKTTFCSLIPRFYEINEGSLTIDNTDIRDIRLKSLRNSIGIVQQDVYMFAGTVKENIAYGKPDASDEEIFEAAKKANIHDFIMSLSDGYDTYVGERGVKLSGGQKQRLSIARVFLKNPPILILDEATSALDNESEKFIQNSLEELSKNRTTLVIAHRLSTIRNADEIIVLTDEGVKEKGTHEELIDMDGVYAYLYNMQFEDIPQNEI